MKFLNLSPIQAAKAQTRLHKYSVLPYHLLLVHTGRDIDERFEKLRLLAMQILQDLDDLSKSLISKLHIGRERENLSSGFLTK